MWRFLQQVVVIRKYREHFLNEQHTKEDYLSYSMVNKNIGKEKYISFILNRFIETYNGIVLLLHSHRTHTSKYQLHVTRQLKIVAIFPSCNISYSKNINYFGNDVQY